MLIGRQGDLRQVRDALDDHRLATLVGPGGVGKTTLARAVAEEQSAESVFFASLAPLDATDLAPAVVGQLGFASFDEFLDAAASQQWLVVLDNCEHVLDAAAELAESLLAATVKLRILATSRERLEVQDERVVRLDPLPTDGSPSPAAELFLSIARQRGADDVLAVGGAAGTAELERIEDLCRRLDGLPLAIELAAARATTMTVAEMLGQLDGSLGLLSRRRARGPGRHRSLSAAIEWSYRELDRDERRLFDALGALGGPFTVEMAAAAVGEPVEVTRSLLIAMVERSLVVHEPVARTSWYRQLATIRAFAAERLDASGGRADAEDRLQAHLVDRADQLDALGLGADTAGPVELGQSYRSFHRAIERAIEQGARDRCHRLLLPLWWMAVLGHQAEACDLLERVVRRWDDDRPEAAAARGVLSVLVRVSRGMEEATVLANRAVEDPGLGRAFGAKTLGQVASVEGRWEDAVAQYQRGAEAARSVAADGLAVEIENLAAMALARKGDLAGSVARLEANLVRTDGSELANVWTGDYLATALLVSDHKRAARLARTAVEVAERSDNAWIAGSANGDLAYAALLDDDVDTAATHAAAALLAFQSIRDRVDITTAFVVAAVILHRRGDHAGAQGALAAEQAMFMTVYGSFESILLERVGPLPERDPGAAPMPTGEIVRRLETPTATRPAPDSGDAADGGRRRTGAEGASAARRFALVGDSWEIVFDGTTILQRDSKGLRDIARLLAAGGRAIAAVDLADAVVVAGDAGPQADGEARDRYRARVSELEAELDRADRIGDQGLADRARAELDRLVEELGRSFGLGGRARLVGDPAEKARTAVTARIRAAINRIEPANPALARHLATTIQTGRQCTYRGDTDPPWDLG
ncbi:MAG: AAA family ATPase [Actinomycetota bacterium]